MREVFVFHPPRRRGTIIHGIIVLCLAAAGGFGIWKASLSVSGITFLAFLAIALVAIAFLPRSIYRFYALQRARYILARDGISLSWGLRREEIPIDRISWVKAADQVEMHVKPFLHIQNLIRPEKTIMK